MRWPDYRGKAGLKSYSQEVFSSKSYVGAFFVPFYLRISKIIRNFAAQNVITNTCCCKNIITKWIKFFVLRQAVKSTTIKTKL